MPTIEASVEIAAPTVEVFRYCHDANARPEWDDRVMRIQMLTTAPVRNGSMIRVDAARSGVYAFSWDGEYIAYRFPAGSTVRVMDAAFSSPFVRGTETWDFSSVGGGTRFSIKFDYQARGFLGRITDALGGRAAMRRAVKRSLANLKRTLEKR